MRNKVLALAKQAISKGLGNYYALPQTTWYDIQAGYNAGNRVDDQSEAKLLQAYKLINQ